MERNRFVSVLLAVSPQSAGLLKNGTGKLKAATDATAAEKAAITKWLSYKVGKPIAAAVAAPATKSAPKPTRKAQAAKKSPAKGDTYTNSRGVTYRRVVTFERVN